MRNDFASFGRKAGKLYSARERGLNRGNRLSIELDEMPPDQAKAMPTSHVRQQTRRYWRWRLTFVRYSLTLGETIKDALIKIDERAPFCTNGRRSRDGACARARINANKNKAGDHAGADFGPSRLVAGEQQTGQRHHQNL